MSYIQKALILLGLSGIGIALFLLLPEGSEYGLRKKMGFENTTTYVRQQVIQCLKTGEASWRGKCFRELGGMLSSQFSLPESLTALAAIDKEEGIKQQCHALVHYLGQNEYKRERDLAATFRSCLSSPVACGEGCFHGAVEGYVSEHGGTLDEERIPSVCSREFTENQVTYDACVHGLGHAFMLQNEGDIYPSLDSCRTLSSYSDRQFCYAGVFMENVFSFWTPEHQSKFIRPDDPSYPCTDVREEYQLQCYGAQAAFVINQALSPNVIEAYRRGADFCASVPSFAQAECYGSIGSNIVVSTEDPRVVVEACSLTPEGAPRNRCYEEALVFIGHGSGGAPERIREVCGFIPDSRDAEHCELSAERVIGTWKTFSE